MDPVKRGLAAYKKDASPPKDLEATSEPEESKDMNAILKPESTSTPSLKNPGLPQVSRPSFPQFSSFQPTKVKVTPEKEPTVSPPIPGLLKTTVETQNKVSGTPSGKSLGKSPLKEKSLRKVAKFLILLGKEEAAKVIRHLSEEEVEDITREIATVKTIDPVEAEKILQDFGYMAAKGTGNVAGGPGMARSILEKALGVDKAQAILKKSAPDQAAVPFAFLDDLEPEIILILLKEESIPVLSIVLPHLKPQKAAVIMKILPLDMQMNLVRRLAKLERVSKEILESIEAKLRDKVRALGTPQETEKVNGRQQLSEILKHMGFESKAILDAVAQVDPQGAEQIRSTLFGPETLGKIRGMDLEKWLRDFEDGELASILLSLDPLPAQKIRAQISSRRLLMVEQEILILQPLTKKEIQRVLKEFFEKLRTGIEAGDLRLEDGEEYV